MSQGQPPWGLPVRGVCVETEFVILTVLLLHSASACSHGKTQMQIPWTQGGLESCILFLKSSIILIFSKAFRKEFLKVWFSWHISVTRAVITELPTCWGVRQLCLGSSPCVVYRRAELSESY